MAILGAIIVPHSPIIIPTVGRGRESEVQNTIDACRAATEQAATRPPSARPKPG